MPSITLRENTEWVETVDDGWNVLAGANEDKIIKKVIDFEPKNKQRDVFGDGNASERIRKIIGGLELNDI